MAAYKYGVIVVTRNRPDLLRECLRHLSTSLNGGPRPTVVVFDNGTDEETPRLAAEAGAVYLSSGGENVSFAKANNAAAKHIKGDLLLLNNDVNVQPGCLEALIRERKNGCDVVGAKLLYPNGRIQHFGIGFSRDYQSFHLGRGEAQDSEWASGNRIVAAATGACLLVRRALWDDLGGFDEGYVFGWEDVDLCLRAKETGSICGVVADAVAIHLESQTAGRSSFDGPNWQKFQSEWVTTGRIYAALGVWPVWLMNAFHKLAGPDAGMMRQFAETGD